MTVRKTQFAPHSDRTIYQCIECNFNTHNKKDYNKHLLTAKHMRLINPINKTPKYPTCGCGKEYKHMSSLWKHKKTCTHTPNPTNEVTENESCESPVVTVSDNTIMILIKQNIELVKDNQEFKQLLIDQNKQMMEMAGNMGNNTVNNTNNNVNSHNKFNLNVFLNEDCKNAMSLTDFVNSMNLTIEDFIQTGELGFVDGISKVMVERINNMDLHDRPVHCTDLKRETVYVKDQDKWEKDEEKVRLRKAVNNVAKDNKSLTSEWMEATPDVNTSGTENYENFFKYSQSALGGMGTDKNKAFEDKIMKNIMKETTIDRGQSIK